MTDIGTDSSPTESLASNERISEEVLQEWTEEANNGNEERQLQLGLHYLKLAEQDIDRVNNATKAVSWLVAASMQGNDTATEKLRHCVETDVDISSAIKDDVKWCLNTSGAEKKIRNAARSLYHKLNSAHKGALSKEEYINAINKMTEGRERERKLLIAAGTKIGSTITENDFVKTLSRKIQGTLTLTSTEMDEKSVAYESAGILTKIFVYPKQTGSIAVERGLEYASKEGLDLILSLIPTNQIYILLLLFLYSYLTPHLILLVVPLVFFYISILVMVVCTLQMFYKCRKLKDSTTLATLLQEQFDMNIDINSTASQYSWNSLTPYLVYFVSLPVTVLSLSLATKAYIPCAELCIVSIIMTGFCFIALRDDQDLLTLITLISHAFASLPMFLANVPQIPIISTFVAFFTQPFFRLDLGLGLYFNLSLPSIVHMLIPLMLVRMAMRDSWSGSYRVVIPHLVCYFWFNMSTIAFPFTTWMGLARASIGYLLIPVVAPVICVVFVLGFFYMLFKLLQTEMIGKLLVTAVLFAVPLLLTQTKVLFGKKGSKLTPQKEKIKKIVMIVFAVLAVIPLLFVRLPSILEKKAIELTWEDYKDLCIPSDGEIWGPYQIRCQDFVGVKVKWSGVVEQVKITKRENTAENVINSLPSILSDPLYCLYGEPIPACDEESMSNKTLKHCQIVTMTGRKCHLSKHNQLSFVLTVKVDGVTVNLDAGSSFQSHLLALMPEDELDFSGALVSVGSSSPGLKLKAMNCTSRQLPVMMNVAEEIDEDIVFQMFSDALTMVFNFGFFPILSYSPN